MRIFKNTASKLTICGALLSFVTCTTFANSKTVPSYTAGGSLPSISAQTALGPMTNTQKTGWWYTTSLLHDQNNNLHSIQFELFRIPMGLVAAGGGALGFTFKNQAGKTLYLWNYYANKQMLADFPVGNLNSTPAGNGKFSIHVTPITWGNHHSELNFELKHDPNDTAHIAGQYGAIYDLTASGMAEVGADQHNIEKVAFTFSAQMQDKRGLMPEGYGGYVGPVAKQQVSANVKASWELALPKLQINHWKLTVTPADPITAQSPLKTPQTFTNGKQQTDTMWLDRQVLYPNAPQNLARNTQGITQIIQDQKNGVQNISPLTLGSSTQLYHGTWMSFCLNKAPYKGYCGDVAVFWNDDITTQMMDSDKNSHGGFLNVDLPVSTRENSALIPGGIVSESLSFDTDHKATPFYLANDASSVFTSPISGNHYAKTVYATVRKNTPINALLNTYNHKTSKPKDIHLKFSAVSTKTENVLLSLNNAFFEGAATVSLCKHNQCTPIGTGFIEQMGYAN